MHAPASAHSDGSVCVALHLTLISSALVHSSVCPPQSNRHADIIIPWPDDPHNDKAIELLVQHVNMEVYKRGLAPQPPAETVAAVEKAVAAVPTMRKNL